MRPPPNQAPPAITLQNQIPPAYSRSRLVVAASPTESPVPRTSVNPILAASAKRNPTGPQLPAPHFPAGQQAGELCAGGILRRQGVTKTTVGFGLLTGKSSGFGLKDFHAVPRAPRRLETLLLGAAKGACVTRRCRLAGHFVPKSFAKAVCLISNVSRQNLQLALLVFGPKWLLASPPHGYEFMHRGVTVPARKSQLLSASAVGKAHLRFFKCCATMQNKPGDGKKGFPGLGWNEVAAM